MGSTSGVRVVVGWWLESPFGAFADVMVETATGHRVLLAPTQQVVELVATTYTFDEVRLEPVTVGLVGDRPARLDVVSPSLTLTADLGARTPLGILLGLVPPSLATSPAFATLADPVARVVLRGVRTRGVARAGRREYYGATDVHGVTAMSGRFDGTDLGALAPVDPPCRFGFSSTPRRPSLTEVTTTIVDVA